MLLYCMTEADSVVGPLPSGVREATVESLAEDGVRCFYSRVEDLGANAESFRADALRFHAVLRQILDRAAVAPFRFPTLLETESELREFLAGEAPAYAQDLQRLRGMVQMEVRIRPEATLPDPQSGKEYMEGRAAEAIRRMEGGSLSDQQVEDMGQALMKLEQKVHELAGAFGLQPEDLNLELGPLGKLLDE